LNVLKQKVAWFLYRLDIRLVNFLKLKRETTFYWWALDLDVSNEIVAKSNHNRYLGL